MLNELRFVQGAVASKDFVPELMHYRIENGTIRSYNGMIGLGCPINLDLNITPKAIPFLKAIQTCKETVQLHVTPAGKLAIKSGKFKAFVDCITEPFPETPLTGTEAPLSGDFQSVLKTLAPFIAEDASRPWARGILFKGQSAYATNNICLIEHWLTRPFPIEVNIPRAAVMELIRIGDEPERIQVTDKAAVFHFSGNRWLRTQLFPTTWPDLSRVLDVAFSATEVPEGLFDAATDLLPFVDDLGRVFLKPGNISTSAHDGEGASVDVPGILGDGIFHGKQLLLLKNIAKTLDLTTYPAPCIFTGDKLRGAIIGMRP